MAVESNDLTPDPTKFEITEREEAILQGRDPDEQPIDEDPPVGEVDEAEEVEEVEEEAAETEPDEQPDPEPQRANWYDEADIRRAQAYGLAKEDLEGLFTSREEFGRYIQASDRAASRRQPEPQRQQVMEDPPAEEEADDSQPKLKDGRVNVAYYKANGYDEGTIAAMEAIRAEQDQLRNDREYLQSLAYQQEQLEYQRQVSEFNRVAAQHNADYYGGEQPTAEQRQHRETLMKAVADVAQFTAWQQEQAGQPVQLPPYDELIRRAEHFAGIQPPAPKQPPKPNVDAVKAQSAKRRGVGGAGMKQPPKSRSTSNNEEDEAIRIANDPDVVAAYEAGAKAR